MTFAHARRAQNAYANPTNPTLTARDAERQVLTQVTARLRAAAEKTGNFPALASALHANRQLWTRLAADVADSGNGLPQALRAQLFYLAEFTDHQTRKILRGEGDAGALVDINTAVIRGLAGNVTPAGAPA